MVSISSSFNLAGGISKCQSLPTALTKYLLHKNSSAYAFSTFRFTSWRNTCVTPRRFLALAITAAEKIADIRPGAAAKYPRGASIMITSHSLAYTSSGSWLRASRHRALPLSLTFGGRHSLTNLYDDKRSSASERRVSYCTACTRKRGASFNTLWTQWISSSRKIVVPRALNAAHMSESWPRPNTRKLQGAWDRRTW